jgi:O-antigen/teichoic acid export membrane protein
VNTIKSFFGKFAHDFSYSFSLNIVTILIKTTFVFILPRIIGVRDFGYWQLYFLYTFFIAFGHLGLVDGIYLKNGGKYYQELDLKLLRSQFLILLLMGMLWALMLFLFVPHFVYDQDKLYVLSIVALDLILTLPRTLLSVVFQMTGMIKEYSYSLMSESVSSFLMIVTMLVLGVRDFRYFIAADCAARLVSLSISIKNSPGFLKLQVATFFVALREALSNISVGIYLLLSNMVGLVIIASVRFAVEHYWGIIVFSKVSLAFSISSVAITATSAASVVLFPLLRRLNAENQEKSFESLSICLLFLLSAAFILYYPGTQVLKWWLPKYTDSFHYLTIILPMTIFDSQFLVVGSNFLKVLRKEHALFTVNLLAVGFTMACIVLSLYCGFPIEFLLACLFIQSLIKMSITVGVIRVLFKKISYSTVVLGCVTALLFWWSNIYLGNLLGFITYAFGFIILALANKSRLMQAVNDLRR